MSYFEEVFEVVDEGATDGEGDEGFAKLVLEPWNIPLPLIGGDPTATPPDVAGDPTFGAGTAGGAVTDVAGDSTFGAGTACTTGTGVVGDPTFAAGTAGGAVTGVAGDPTFGAGTAGTTGTGVVGDPTFGAGA